MRRAASALTGALLLTGCTSGPTPEEQRRIPEVGVAGDVILDEQFDTLDRSRWNVVVTGRGFTTTNDEVQAYVDDPDVAKILHDEDGAEGGALQLRLQHTPGHRAADGRTYDFTSARLNTKDRLEYRYGKLSARIRLDVQPGAWPALWQLGSDLDETGWPTAGETDILENVGEEWTSTALHGPGYSGRTPLSGRAAPEGGVGKWHVYGMVWNEESITFTLDGEETHRVSRAEVEDEGAWAYDRPQYLVVNLALGGAYPGSENGVSRPYEGVPEETVEAVQAGEVRMLVDWIRIER